MPRFKVTSAEGLRFGNTTHKILVQKQRHFVDTRRIHGLFTAPFRICRAV
jgi:hypothetical protein